MQLELLHAALEALAELATEAHVRAVSAPTILAAILAVHAAYFVRNRRIIGQQGIVLHDLTDLAQSTCAGADRLTVVQADRREFDAATRMEREALFPASSPVRAAGKRVQRLREPQTIEDAEVHRTLICGDDLIVRGSTTFFHPLKVAGDLIVEGEATFLAPAIVSGVLKVIGSAHFAEGVIAKGDAMIRGSMTIGSDTGKGWGVVRELALEQFLRLNGTLVASRAVQLKRAA